MAGTAYGLTKNHLWLSIAITSGTTFYHFAMRLSVGYIIDAKFHNRMDYTRKWFRQKSFEPELYKRIRVKKWKKRLPTFYPENFQLEKNNVADIIQTTCQSEIVHEVIMVLSFVPVLFSVWLGSVEIFLITSVISFLFDGTFVILQRYNRPRLMRLIQK